jgi:hypothetical protein
VFAWKGPPAHFTKGIPLLQVNLKRKQINFFNKKGISKTEISKYSSPIKVREMGHLNN